MTEERSETLSALAEAGCRLERACNELGLDVRTAQRWRAQPAGGLDARRGPRTQPRQKLSAKERAKVLDIADTPQFRGLSPKQIVPRLADQGECIAGELLADLGASRSFSRPRVSDDDAPSETSLPPP